MIVHSTACSVTARCMPWAINVAGALSIQKMELRIAATAPNLIGKKIMIGLWEIWGLLWNLRGKSNEA